MASLARVSDGGPFAGYQLDDAWDEMFDSSGDPRPHYRELYSRLLAIPADELSVDVDPRELPAPAVAAPPDEQPSRPAPDVEDVLDRLRSNAVGAEQRLERDQSGHDRVAVGVDVSTALRRLHKLGRGRRSPRGLRPETGEPVPFALRERSIVEKEGPLAAVRELSPDLVGRAAVHDEVELETATVGRRRSHYGGELGTRPVDADLEQRYSLSMDGHAGKLRSVHGECDAAKTVRFSQADAVVMRLVEEKDGRRARESGLGAHDAKETLCDRSPSRAKRINSLERKQMADS